jgi:uncharacterized protein YndB with AHSA1/START domain
MKEMQFQVDINASKEKVWNTLWRDETFRQWASVIDPETYMIGDLIEGGELQFISSRGGYGVTSLIEELTVNEFLLLRHSADTQEEGKQEREKEWTGGEESYRLAEKGTTTTLIVTFDVPLEQEVYFKINYPKALERVKELTEVKK